MEDEVKFADILEALVERFHEDLDEVEDAKLGLAAVHAEHGVEGGVMPSHNITVLHRCHYRSPPHHSHLYISL